MAYTESRSAPITIFSRKENDFMQDTVSTRRSFSSMSAMGGATGAMKKFLSRRRGNTGDGYESVENLPRLQAFEIVGGNGGISPGTTVYDVEPLHSPRSSVKISLTTNSPVSPKSPTFHTMFGRFGRDKTHPRVGSMTEIQGLAPSVTEKARKKLNRRSLSADSLPLFRADSDKIGGATKEQHIHPLAMAPSNGLNSSTITSISGVNNLANNTSAANDLLESDPEFYHNSVEFLNMHHSRSHTEDWAKRNKRHTGIARRQSESSLLNIISEQYQTSDDRNYGMWDRTLGVGASSESLPLPLTSWSSPTQYYDCPQTRNVVRFYLANNEYQFDEMLESGFPSRSLRLAEETTEDSHFMTLRLTLTPWHARAEESKLYGPENAIKPPHLRSMVYKLFSRSSSSLLLSTSSPMPSSVSSIARHHVAKDSNYSGMDDERAQGDRSISMTSTSSVFTSYTSSPISCESSALSKKPRGRTRDRGFRIVATPVGESLMSPIQTRNHQYLSSPPLTPVQPRSGSLSALSLPIYSNELSPPSPPRRKASTPALFYSLAHGNTSSLSLPETIERPRSAVPTKSGLRKAAAPVPSVDANPLVDAIPIAVAKGTRHSDNTNDTLSSAHQQQPPLKSSELSFSSTMTTVESDVDGIDITSRGLRYNSPPITPPSSYKQIDDTCQNTRKRQQPLRSNIPSVSPQHQVDISPSRPSPVTCHRSAPSTPMNPQALAPWQYQEFNSNGWTASYPGDVQSQRSSNDLQQQYQQNHYNLQQQQQRWHQSRSQQQQQQQQDSLYSPVHHQAKHPLSPTAIDGRDRTRVFSYAHPRPHGESFPQAPPVGVCEGRKRNMSVPSIYTGHTIGQHFVFPQK